MDALEIKNVKTKAWSGVGWVRLGRAVSWVQTRPIAGSRQRGQSQQMW